MVIVKTIEIEGPDGGLVTVQVSHNTKPGAEYEAKQLGERIAAMFLASPKLTLRIGTGR